MKGLGGFELYEKMRKIDENIHICFISASNTYEKYKRLYPEIQKDRLQDILESNYIYKPA